jgi:hypothetical protein
MDIETVIVGIVVLALVGVMYRYWPKGKGLDVNEDGKVDSADAKAAVEVVAAKVVEEVKIEAAKVEEVVVAKYKEELAAFVEAETKVAKEIVAEVEKVIEEVKAVEAKVEEVVVAEVKKTKSRVKKAADVNEDGKVDVSDVVAAVKKGGRPKKSA